MGSLGLLFVILCFQQAYGGITFMALGDWGADPYDLEATASDDVNIYGVDDQERVRDQMEVFAATYPTDFVMTTGDNFYPDGVLSLDDPRWDDAWRNIYNSSNLATLPWWATLGNHDHVIDGRAAIQVNMTRHDPLWNMPLMFYDRYLEKDGIKVHFIALDTETITFNQFDYEEEQLAWFNNTLENAEPSDWTIVYAHHPIKTCGRYSPGNFILRRDILPAMEQWNVDLYIDGHDHNLQHIVRNDSMTPEFVVTGGGGKGRYEYSPIACREVFEDGYTLNFFAERYGFVAVFIEKESVTLGYYGDMGADGQLEELYSYTTYKTDLY